MEDDFSRKIIAHDVRPDETAFSLSDILEMGLENARKEGHLTGNDPMPPKLYSDNGSGFTSKILAEYLSRHGIKHIFGTPYHPQGRGKIERFNRRVKEKLCLVVYCSPDELKKVVDETIAKDIQGRLVGAVLCGHDERRGYIHHLAVRPDCRRKGLGGKLIQVCLGRLNAAGIQKCHIFIFKDNTNAIDF